MAGFNGAGLFVRSFSWQNDKLNGINITASRCDTEDNNFATGLSTCLTKDGQQTTTALIPFSQGLSFNTGTVSAPGLCVIGDLTTGFYQTAGGSISFTSAGVLKSSLNGSGVTLYGSASGNCTISVAATAGSSINFRLPTSNGTSGYVLQTDGTGITSWVSVASGTGTVNSGTSGQLAYYASSTTAVSGNANVTVSGSTLTLGVAASALGTLSLAGSTSGTTAIQPAVAASGTLTLPAATDTLVGKATTDTLTNKTYDTAGTGNTFKIGGTSISAISGNTNKVATVTGALTSGHIATFDASGNIQDGGTSSNAITLLNTVNASAALVVSFNSTYITSTYNKYIIEFDSVFMDTADNLLLQFSTDNGTTPITTGYNSTYYSMQSSLTVNSSSSANGALLAGGITFNNLLKYGGMGTVVLSKPSSVLYQQAEWKTSIPADASANLIQGTINYPVAQTINYIRFAPLTGGRHVTGTFKLYGVL